jgi:hypothetical protein
MSSNNNYDDLKIQRVLQIMRHDDAVTFYMSQNQEVNAAHSIALLLDRLDLKDTDTEMLKIRREITLENYDMIPSIMISRAYRTYQQFLNATIYKDFNNRRPTTNTKSMGDIQRTVDTARHTAGM